jgi:hypothetical protein
VQKLVTGMRVDQGDNPATVYPQVSGDFFFLTIDVNQQLGMDMIRQAVCGSVIVGQVEAAMQ